jgi:hypothetical protein
MSQEIDWQRHHFNDRGFVIAGKFDLDPSELLPWRPEQAQHRSLDVLIETLLH